MKILVTGANGFVGKNLCASLANIRDGKDRTRPQLIIDEIYAYDMDSSPELLDAYCQKCDFVFHLAGINRPQDPGEYMQGNAVFMSRVLDLLRKHRNKCPFMLSSSIQATCQGRYNNDYGKSKRAAEALLFAYSANTDTPILIYRFPNLFGKWSRSNYNSAIATFCYNMAHDLPITVHDRNAMVELIYIDDLVREMLDALEGKAHRCSYDGLKPIFEQDGLYCAVPTTHMVSLGEVVDLLTQFHDQPCSLVLPEIKEGSFAKKLYSTYLSYLPPEKIAFPLQMHQDTRGSFTELLKTEKCGQFSVNISLPGVTKGQHWHHSKWEFFIVVSGQARIEMREIGSDRVLRFDVSGDKIQAVHMLPGYTHSIMNLSETENLVTLMWANESFDPERPDTFQEAVQ